MVKKLFFKHWEFLFQANNCSLPLYSQVGCKMVLKILAGPLDLLWSSSSALVVPVTLI